jgi:hypothetical protein
MFSAIEPKKSRGSQLKCTICHDLKVYVPPTQTIAVALQICHMYGQPLSLTLWGLSCECHKTLQDARKFDGL